LLVIPNWAPEAFVKFEWNDWFRELVEITSKDVGGIMDGIACPVESFAKSIRRVKGSLELFDALFGSGKSKDTLYIGS